jgi:Fe-S-cluster containining protein
VKRKKGARKLRIKKNWYKPAGARVNKILDDFQLNIERIHESFLRNMHPLLQQDGLTISCKQGCTHCCQCAFVCTFLEGLCIARHLLVRGEDLEALWPTLRQHENMQKKAGAPKWFKLGISCLFLKDGQCDIYSVRPLNCRTHYAVSDPELCNSGEGNAKILATEAVMDLRTAVAKGSTQRLVGRDDLLVATLPGAVNLGIHALTTGKYDMRGQTLEGEALEAFKKDWQDTSADVTREAEEESQKEKKDDGP